MKKKRAALYARVSTTANQSTEAQESELSEYAERRGWIVHKIYTDSESGAKLSRPALDALMADCQRRRVDVVLVWKFDRFARSVKHLIEALELFRSLGIDFVSATEGVDTTTPAGQMVFTVLAAVGELERQLIAERVRIGLANARKKGKRLGRAPKKALTDAEFASAKADMDSGRFSLRKLAAKYETSLWTMQQLAAGKRVGA